MLEVVDFCIGDDCFHLAGRSLENLVADPHTFDLMIVLNKDSVCKEVWFLGRLKFTGSFHVEDMLNMVRDKIENIMTLPLIEIPKLVNSEEFLVKKVALLRLSKG